MPKAATMRVDVKPAMLRWARERAGLEPDALAHRFPKLADWEREEARPTLRQLEDFAKATHVPVGYLFLSEPPVERVPIPDFRTVENRRIGHPSPDLLETIYLCQQRQEWYRDYVRSLREEALSFIGSATPESDVVQTAAEIRQVLGFEIEERRQNSKGWQRRRFLPDPWRSRRQALCPCPCRQHARRANAAPRCFSPARLLQTFDLSRVGT
jgi:transcriptional regulator with XRE-family HTH domain